MRRLKGLEDIIRELIVNILDEMRRYASLAVTIVSPRMGEDGWPFANIDPFPGAEVDPINNAEHIKDIYLKVEPGYSGR